MKLDSINANLIEFVESLHSKATSAVYYNGSVGEWFRTTVGVRQGCLLSPTLFNIFFKRIMTDALEDHKGSVTIGGRTITNLRFADDIDALAGKEEELVKLVNHLDMVSTTYGMEISAEKTKLMTNNIKGIILGISIGGQKLETVQSFKYLCSVVMDEGSKQEILSRIAQTIGTLTKLKTIWKDKNIAFGSRIRLVHSLVISVFLYACQTWTLTAHGSALTAIKISPAAPAAEATAADSCLLSVLLVDSFLQGGGGGGEGGILVSFVRIKHIVYNNVIRQLLIWRGENALSINTKQGVLLSSDDKSGYVSWHIYGINIVLFKAAVNQAP